MGSNSVNNKIPSEDKTKDIFKDLKADYFLQKLFDNLEIKKLLLIVKYNKKKKKRINININDYKEYSEIHSSIEIEIIPKKNIYDPFIFINKEEEGEKNRKYYHIYFDDNKEEIKRQYLNQDDKVKKIKIKIDPEIKSFYELFFDFHGIESIYFKKFFRKNITNMSYMFL